MEERLNEIFNELQKEAYNIDYHTYDYKTTNQIIRKHFEKLVGQIEPLVIPKIAEDKAKKMKECKHLNKVYEQGWLVDDFYCKDCGKIF